MLIDTDVLVWNLRGNERARSLLDSTPGFTISAVSYMELVQGLRNKSELRTLRQALHFWRASVLPIDSEISARAMFLVEEYSLSHSMQMADALIAASAQSSGLTLLTANDKHYKYVDGLDVSVFRP